MKFVDYPSPNFDERKNGIKPDMIILHFTGMESTKAALDRLTDPKHEVSAHYLVDEDGTIYKMVDEEKRAWHAGVSDWKEKGYINSHSIGIEISNRNGESYPPEQLAAVTALCRDIMKRHNITPDHVQGHADIAPDRKQDPGEHFPWKRLARYGIGIWPDISLKHKFNVSAIVKDAEKLKELFKKAGYPVDGFGKHQPSLHSIIMAFQRHYEPYVFKAKKDIGVATEKTVKKLHALIHHKHENNDVKKPKIKIKNKKPPKT